jgi:hypothetical protein
MTLLAQSVRVLENFGQLEYADHTTVHPVGLTLLVLCCAALVGLPRRLAIVPILVMALLIPSAQRIVVVSLDFTYLRILIIVGVLRVLARSEHGCITWWKLDALVPAWAFALFAASMIRTGGNVLEYQCGVTLDAVGAYFLLRCLFKGWDDVVVVAQTCALMSVPLALAFLLEHATQRNLFSVFGGVQEVTGIRQDRLRCMGPYNHPILAGCVWASLAPLCAALWFRGLWRKVQAGTGIVCSLLIVYCSASSTPLLGVLTGAVAFAAFPLRNHTRLIRWGLACSLIGLHLVMNAPVWHLIARISAVGGSTGYHRFLLIDNFVNRFAEWAFMGTNSTAHWFWGGQDVTNHFVMQGVRGGFLTFAFFVAGVALAFGAAGRARRIASPDRQGELVAWSVGVSLLVHCACFIGVSYFGQITMLWFMTLAIAGILGGGTLTTAAPKIVNRQVKFVRSRSIVSPAEVGLIAS